MSTSSNSSLDSISNHRRSRNKKLDEVERLAELERIRRQKENEQKVSHKLNFTRICVVNPLNLLTLFQIIEEEAQKRIEFLVKKRVEEELEKRKDEIEFEVTKRVEAAKRQIEQEMLIELEKRREQARLEEKRREVCTINQEFILENIGFWTRIPHMQKIYLFHYLDELL